MPKRRIHLTNDDPPVDVYDTSGPQGCDVRVGVPKPREEWIKAPRDERVGQLQPDALRQAAAIITEEMAYVAAREGVEPEFVR